MEANFARILLTNLFVRLLKRLNKNNFMSKSLPVNSNDIDYSNVQAGLY